MSALFAGVTAIRDDPERQLLDNDVQEAAVPNGHWGCPLRAPIPVVARARWAFRFRTVRFPDPSAKHDVAFGVGIGRYA